MSASLRHQDHPRLRRRLLKILGDTGAVQSRAVGEAFLQVPRHLFVPGVDPKAVYSDIAVVTRYRDGMGVSSSSQPQIMAVMLEQLGVAPGQRALEVGAGTGYNAALLAHLAGPAGRVVTIDIDPEVAAEAGEHLRTAGFEQVEVVAADGALGAPWAAPFDRIIVTASCWEIPPAWVGQLVEGGVLVLPLRVNAAMLSLALRKEGRRLVGVSSAECGFMYLQGAFGRVFRAPLPESAAPFVDAGSDAALTTGQAQRLGRLLARQPRRFEEPALLDALRAGLSFLTYLGVTGERLFHVRSGDRPGRLRPWGSLDRQGQFQVLPALADPHLSSLCVLRWAWAGGPALDVYGSDAAIQRLREAHDRWLAAGKPGGREVRALAEPARGGGPLLPRPQPDGSFSFYRGAHRFTLRLGSPGGGA